MAGYQIDTTPPKIIELFPPIEELFCVATNIFLLSQSNLLVNWYLKKEAMDPLFLAYSYYRRKKYEQCTEICTQLLEKNPYDQVTLFLLIENV